MTESLLDSARHGDLVAVRRAERPDQEGNRLAGLDAKSGRIDCVNRRRQPVRVRGVQDVDHGKIVIDVTIRVGHFQHFAVNAGFRVAVFHGGAGCGPAAA